MFDTRCQPNGSLALAVVFTRHRESAAEIVARLPALSWISDGLLQEAGVSATEKRESIRVSELGSGVFWECKRKWLRISHVDMPWLGQRSRMLPIHSGEGSEAIARLSNRIRRRLGRCSGGVAAAAAVASVSP
jgi:hypothetical protein